MTCALVKGTFDPITEEEVQLVRTLMKKRNLQKVFFQVTGEGILSVKQREQLVKKAISRYRKFACTQKQLPEETVKIELSEACKETERKVRAGQFTLSAHGTKKVLTQNGYYFDQILDACCNAHRANHSRSVATLCAELARASHHDELTAWKAGMLHDVTKKWDDERGKKLLAIYDPEKLSLSPKIWHSYTAPVWIKNELGITDPVILNAIYHHTLGDSEGWLDMILYIADKTDPSRGYDSSKQINASKKSLKAGFDMVHEDSRKYLLEKEGINV